jgi:outer membrane murein-binding lipoprotein Lpp
MKIRLTILLLAIVLGSCAPSVPQDQYDQAQSTIQALDSQGAQLQATATYLEGSVAQADTQIASLEASLAQRETAIGDLEAQVQTLTRERNEARRQLEATIGAFQCEETLSAMDYTSIMDASTMLMAFVAQQPWAERVQGTFRDSIWTNAGSKIHGIRYVDSSDHLPYVTYFMVYFEEFSWDRGVFWIDRQCWLEGP